jgi:hypothetical protein
MGDTADGVSSSFPWMAVYTTGFANVTTCELAPVEGRRLAEAGDSGSGSGSGIDADTDTDTVGDTVGDIAFTVPQSHRADAAAFGFAHHREVRRGRLRIHSSSTLIATLTITARVTLTLYPHLLSYLALALALALAHTRHIIRRCWRDPCTSTPRPSFLRIAMIGL